MLRLVALCLVMMSPAVAEAQTRPDNPSYHEGVVQFRAKRDELKNLKPVRPPPLTIDPERERRQRSIHGSMPELPDLRNALPCVICR